MGIKKIRMLRRMTIKTLSEKSGVAVGYISDIENGKAHNPSINTLKKIASALKVSVSELIDESGM